MATIKIVMDDPDGETKRQLKEIGEVVERPYAWVLRKIVADAHARVFEYSEDGARTGVVKPKGLASLGLR